MIKTKYKQMTNLNKTVYSETAGTDKETEQSERG